MTFFLITATILRYYSSKMEEVRNSFFLFFLFPVQKIAVRGADAPLEAF